VRGPRHLWSGDWRSDAIDARRAEEPRLPRRQRREPEQADEQPAAPEPRPPRRRRTAFRVLGPAVVVVALVLGAFAIASRDDGSERSNEPAQREALPAEVGKRLEPRPGQTLAGAVFEKASGAVLSVRAGNGSGTAFLVDDEGTIVTNSHVVSDADRVSVRFGREGNTIPAEVAGADASIDIAVLTIDKSRIPGGTKPLKFADSRNVRVGDLAIAIGNPFGLERTATEGIVSAVDRDIQAPNGFSIDSVIQTDAPINPGNSGGPLLDDAGLVIGVNSQIATSGVPGNVGIGFAVPSNTVRAAVPALRRGETIKRPWLGVETSVPLETSEEGAQVRRAQPGGPADRAGLRVGDVIKSVDGENISDPSALSAQIGKKQVGDVIDLVIERRRSTQSLSVTLGTRPTRTR